MTCAPLDVEDVRGAIHARLRARHAASIVEVARELHVSRSTLQRVLAKSECSFTALRQRIRVDYAAWELVMRGASLSWAAFNAGVSREHLSRLIKAHLHLRPSELEHLHGLYTAVRYWSSGDSLGNSLNVEERQRRYSVEREIHELLGRIPTHSERERGPYDTRVADSWIRQVMSQLISPDPQVPSGVTETSRDVCDLGSREAA